jgi:hypothetical protein
LFETNYITSHSGGSAVQFNTKVATSHTPGAYEVWGIFSGQHTTADDASHASVAVYSQMIRDSVPVASVGVPMLGAVIEARSLTGSASSVDGQIRTLELDLVADGADDHASGGRVVMPILIGNQSGVGTAQVSGGISINPATVGTIEIGKAYSLAVPFYVAALHTVGATQGASAHAIWLGSDQHIALNNSGTITVRWDSSVSRIRIAATGVDIFSIDTSGNVRAAGTITGSTTP